MTKKKDIEIEIKVQIEKSKNLLSFLKRNGKFIGQEHQLDEYYTPLHRNFIKKGVKIKEWLRLRNSTDKISINYKYFHFDKNGRGIYCDEFETTIGNLGQMKKIFSSLNVKKIIVVNKVRRVWLYKEYEIAIDDIKGLGKFIEIEYKGSKIKPQEVTRKMIVFLKKLNCGKIIRNHIGYPHMLLFPEQIDNQEL